MYLKINDDIKIDLPDDLMIDERKDLCNEIIEKHKEYFNYTLPTSKSDRSGENVQKRLSVLASYLYNTVKDIKTDNILTNHKERRDNVREIKFSVIDGLYKHGI